MEIIRRVIVFDSADLETESAFWAGILGGKVVRDDDWHSVIDSSGQWCIGVQLSPNHIAPEWPDGDQQQQIHIDLHADNPRSAHDEAIQLGARMLRSAPNLDDEHGFQVYADPAGHPFCIGWGHPSKAELETIVARQLG